MRKLRIAEIALIKHPKPDIILLARFKCQGEDIHISKLRLA